jgi:hypothetical protein
MNNFLQRNFFKFGRDFKIKFRRFIGFEFDYIFIEFPFGVFNFG